MCSCVDVCFCCLGNPLEEKHTAEGDWRDKATQRLPKLKKLDGIPIVGGDEEEEG